MMISAITVVTVVVTITFYDNHVMKLDESKYDQPM